MATMEQLSLRAVRSLAADLGVSDNVEFSHGWVPVSDLLAAIADADVGLVAMKR
ncbi:MAG: hypothetical protein H0U00_02580, partial [Actinobacteria bacterium]|nr:hypothetical protein [Actinomycetota bacterium]